MVEERFAWQGKMLTREQILAIPAPTPTPTPSPKTKLPIPTTIKEIEAFEEIPIYKTPATASVKPSKLPIPKTIKEIETFEEIPVRKLPTPSVSVVPTTSQEFVKPSVRTVVERRPAVATYVPKDISAPIAKFGQRTITAAGMEEVAATWREPATFKEAGAVEQFAISAAAWPAETGVGLISFGFAAVGDPLGVPKMIKRGIKETAIGIRRGRPSVLGSIAGGLLWTVGLPKAIGRYESYKTGISPGESIYQPKYAKPEIVGKGKLDIKTGKIPFVSKAKVGKARIVSAGVSKEIEAAVPGTRISLVRAVGKEPGYVSLGYDIAVPAGERAAVSAGVFEVKKITGMVERPTGRWFGGYGAVPATEVTFETGYVTTKALSKMVGEPVVSGEFTLPRATWRDPTVEMVKLRTGYGVKGLSISPEGFQPFIGKAAFELTAPIIPTGGGAGMTPPITRVPSYFGGGVTLAAPWAKGSEFAITPTAVAGGRMAEAAMFKTKKISDAPQLARLEREGYIVKRKQAVAMDVGMDIGKASKTFMRTATRQARRTGLKQVQKFDVAQESALGQEISLGLKRGQKQAQQLELGLQYKFAPTPITPIVPSAFVPFPPFIGTPRFELPSWPKRRAPRRRKVRRRKPKYKYTPTLIGMRQARYGGPVLQKAPKFVGVQAVGIRPPVGRKRKKGKKRTAKQRKRRYQKNFARSLGL